MRIRVRIGTWAEVEIPEEAIDTTFINGKSIRQWIKEGAVVEKVSEG